MLFRSHGPAPIPEEGKWVQAKEITDISGLTHGVGWCAPQQGACKMADAHHGSSGEQQRNLHRSLAVNSHIFFTLSLFLHLIIPLRP